MKWFYGLIILSLLATTFVLGRYTAPEPAPTEEELPTAEGPDHWTCPMHPEIDLPDPVPCPKCGMKLVKKTKGDDLGPRQMSMSEASRKLAEIETTEVTRRFLTKPVRMTGKVDYDETGVQTIAARVPGRIDRMFVDYTGVSVKKGDHLVSLYSPSLLTAQQELLEARKRLQNTADESSKFLRESNQEAYRSARDKLLLWGLSAATLDALVKRGKAEDHMGIDSPSAGVVIEKFVDQGDYVTEGSKVYRVADLSKLWVRLDAYEQDLSWLRFGQSVAIQTEALPGEVFEGWIAFIAPILDNKIRTVKVRVNVANDAGKLKPGMFVRAVVRSRVADGGRVLDTRLAGKWVSPMHPEIIKDEPGKCDVCGMALVTAEELGYVSSVEAEKPIVVPTSAVLVTGTRAVVYVAVPNRKQPTYEGRVVILGPRAGDSYIIRSGLNEHERVVVHGAFRIDSSMQIAAKPSMMSMPSESSLFLGADTEVFRRSLAPLFDVYFAMQKRLAGDDLPGAKTAATKLTTALASVNAAALSHGPAMTWREERRLIATAVAAMKNAEVIAALRVQFRELSRSILTLEQSFRHPTAGMHYETFCPMAFGNRGASWLQAEKTILNPYFGKSMLYCGEVRTEFAGITRKGDGK